MTVEGIKCNVTIARAPYQRRLSMSTGKLGKTFGGRERERGGGVRACVQKAYAVRVIRL